MARPREFKTRLIVLLASSILSCLISVSLPTFPTLDMARAHFDSSVNGTNGIDELRLGPWTYCVYRSNETVDPCIALSQCHLNGPEGSSRLCSPPKSGYDVHANFHTNGTVTFDIGSSWTRALSVHPAAAICICICLFLLCLEIPKLPVTYCALLIAIIAFLSDVAFFYHIQHVLANLDGGKLGAANTGPGFWASLSSVLFIFLEVCASSSEVSFIKWKQSLWTKNPGLIRIIDKSEKTKTHYESSIGSTEVSFTCPVCWESISNLSALPCGHIFCTECIKFRLSVIERCPECQASYTAHDLRNVYLIHGNLNAEC